MEEEGGLCICGCCNEDEQQKVSETTSQVNQFNQVISKVDELELELLL